MTDDQLTASYTLTLSCPDRPGIVHAVAGALVQAGGNITESQQYESPEYGTLLHAGTVATGQSYPELHERLQPVAQEFGMTWSLHREGVKMRTLLMASKSGHCLNHLLFLQRSGTLPIEIPAIVSNHRIWPISLRSTGSRSTTFPSRRTPSRRPSRRCWTWPPSTTSNWWSWPATCRSSPTNCARS